MFSTTISLECSGASQPSLFALGLGHSVDLHAMSADSPTGSYVVILLIEPLAARRRVRTAAVENITARAHGEWKRCIVNRSEHRNVQIGPVSGRRESRDPYSSADSAAIPNRNESLPGSRLDCCKRPDGRSDAQTQSFQLGEYIVSLMGADPVVHQCYRRTHMC